MIDAESDLDDQLASSIRQSLAACCPPDKRREIFEASGAIDDNTWKSLQSIGIPSLPIPAKFGGLGLGMPQAALVSESIGATATPGPFIGQLLSSLAISLIDNERLKADILPKIADGTLTSTFVFGPKWSREMRDGGVSSGRITLDAPFVLGMDRAHLYVVVVDDTIAVVERNADGITVAHRHPFDRTRELASMSFANTPCISVSDRISAISHRLLDAGLILIAADALGGAQTCLDMSVNYAKTRWQFGRPVGSFQAIKHQLADMALAIEPARALVLYAAQAFEIGSSDARIAAAHAAAHMTDRFLEVTRSAVEVHGGIGYSWDYDLHIWLRRAMFDRSFLGTPSSHRLRIADLSKW